MTKVNYTKSKWRDGHFHLINGKCFKRKQNSTWWMTNASKIRRIFHVPQGSNTTHSGKTVLKPNTPLQGLDIRLLPKNFPLDRDQLLPIKSRETSPTDKQSNKWAALVTSQMQELRQMSKGKLNLAITLYWLRPAPQTNSPRSRSGGPGYPHGQQ